MPVISKQIPKVCECGSHAWIEMKRGQAMVDAEDASFLDRRGWGVNQKGYVESPRNGRLHRAIMEAPKGALVDHINHDRLDNRRANLRICTNSESVRNRRPFKNCASKYQGVSWYKANSRWSARVRKDGVRHFAGYFLNEEDAARARDKLAKKLHGEFAFLNFNGEG